jgi:hypothetical protein
LGVFSGGDTASGFIQKYIYAGPRRSNGLPIDANPVGRRIHLKPRFFDLPAVDLHPSGQN